jgi:NAD(P)-dependent dehydrogenase (short-subunit alcohol dehydrogenase family)
MPPLGRSAAGVALVTGANRGLGRLAALALAGAGFKVGLLGRSLPGLIVVANEIASAGGRAAVAVADVRVFNEVRVAVADIEHELDAGVDLLLNNAGVIDPVEVPVWAADPDDWWDVVETDLRGPFHLVRAVVPGMVERGAGRVITVNSGVGAGNKEIYSGYAAAKAGLFRITGNLHLAGYQHGLRAFDISPGSILTDMTSGMPMHAGRTEWTPAEAFLDLVLAAAQGELDAWAGCYVRAGVDTPASLQAAAGQLTGAGPRAEAGSGAGQPAGLPAAGPLVARSGLIEDDEKGLTRAVPSPIRRLGVVRWGEDDPLPA